MRNSYWIAAVANGWICGVGERPVTVNRMIGDNPDYEVFCFTSEDKLAAWLRENLKNDRRESAAAAH